jgi:replication factor A2
LQGGSGSKGAPKREPSTLVPVTLRMVQEAPEAPGGKGSLFYGKLFNQIKICANVLTVETQETHKAVSVEDGTGPPVTIRIYTDGNESMQINESQYYIFPCKAPTKGQLTAFTAIPVTDHNQITVHALDCILQQKKANSKLRGAEGQQMGQQQANGYRPQAAAAAGMNGYGNGMKSEPAHGAYGMLPPGSVSTGDPIRDQVLSAFATGEEAHLDAGCSISSVVAQLQAVQITFQQVQEAIAALTNEGHLYSTIDEEHYKPTAQ